MGIFSTIGGIIGAKKMKKASKKAERAQIAAMEKAIGEQRRQFDVTSGQFAPYREAGQRGLTGYENLLGTGAGGAEAQQAAIEQLRNSPFYQSLYRTGEEAVLQNAAATGGIRGGNTERGLADFGADTLAKTIQQQLAALGGLSEMGLSAVGSLGQFGAHTADVVSGLMEGQGQARAGGLLTRGGLSAGIWQGLGSLGDTALSAIGGGIGGGFGSALSGLGSGSFNMPTGGGYYPGSSGMSVPSLPPWLLTPGGGIGGGSMPVSLGSGLGSTPPVSWGG